MSRVLANINEIISGTAPVAWADLPRLSVAQSILSANSIILLSACVPVGDPTTVTSRTPEFRFAVDGVREGPHVTVYQEANASDREETDLASLFWALTGLTGVHTFSLQWQRLFNIPSLDINRQANLTIIEIP